MECQSFKSESSIWAPLHDFIRIGLRVAQKCIVGFLKWYLAPPVLGLGFSSLVSKL